MAHTLASIRDQVEINLADSSNLIWSATILDEAIRAAILDISRLYDEVLTLNGLDGALATTVDDLDAYILVKGAVAHALYFRITGRYEEATPEPNMTPALVALAQDRMSEFRSYLTQMQLALTDEIEYNRLLAMIADDQDWQSAEALADRTWKTTEREAKETREDGFILAEATRKQELQESVDEPYSQWDWEEEDSF